jgi:predicted RNA-binding Zn ribbon-like protein
VNEPTDPRPLVGEPLPLDLLNTVKLVEGHPVDLFDDLAGVRAWLAVNGLKAPATDTVRDNLREARDGIRAVATKPQARAAQARLNDVLSRGCLSLRLLAGGRVQAEVTTDDPAWHPGVLAAYGMIDLLERAPDRIRSCDHPDCELWFLDTSRNGTRRWCSMERCGNRAKAKRHYDRQTARMDP